MKAKITFFILMMISIISVVRCSSNAEKTGSSVLHVERPEVPPQAEMEIYPELTGTYIGMVNGTQVTLQLTDAEGTFRRITNHGESSGTYTVDFDDFNNCIYILLQGENERYFVNGDELISLIRNNRINGEEFHRVENNEIVHHDEL